MKNAKELVLATTPIGFIVASVGKNHFGEDCTKIVIRHPNGKELDLLDLTCSTNYASGDVDAFIVRVWGDPTDEGYTHSHSVKVSDIQKAFNISPSTET